MDTFPPQEDGGCQPPPIMNPQLQVFGGDYDPEDDALNNYNYFPEDSNPGSIDDNNDAKRRRIARACDMCRKKKIKCDGGMPACKNCINYKTECIFTQVEKKRNPPKGAKYIEGLENRLGRMESLLKLSGLLGDEDDQTDLGTLEKMLLDRASAVRSPTKSPRGSDSVAQTPGVDNWEEMSQDRRRSSTKDTASSLTSVDPKQEEVEALSEMMCSLVTNNSGETRYIGSSSGFSIFSPKGLQWVSEKTGDDSFQKMAAHLTQHNKWVHWSPEIFGDIFSRRVFKPLPPLSETLSLLKDYFENFNYMFPLFHEPTFMHLVRRHYSQDPYEGSGWWASLNIVLAIAHRLRVIGNLVSREEDQKASGYLKNALAAVAELTMRNTDLLSVQALIGMTLYLQGTSNPQPAFFLIAAAIRLAHGIGLHKRGTGFGLNPVEAEQRKRVFWIAYLLDKEISLRSGRPPAQDDDDMNVELPSEEPGDNIGNVPLADGKGKTNIFRLMCTFAIIQGKVYKLLYSTRATKKSDGELLNTIGELDKALEDWKDAIPIDFRPGHDIKASHTPLILHVVLVHFAYYNCLATMHRMSVHHGYWTSRLSNYAIQGLSARPLNPRVFYSATLCVQAARASIQLVRYIPQGNHACVWMALYYPITSLVTVFANVLQNPLDPRARSDQRLMHQVVNFLSALSMDEGTGDIKIMMEVCSEFERIAKVVLDKADKDPHGRRKRKCKKDEGESLEPANTAASPPTNHSTPTATAAPALTHARVPDKRSVPTSEAAPAVPALVFPDSVNEDPINQTFNNFDGYSSPNSNGEMPMSMPVYGSGPGDFPNMYTGFSDRQQFGNAGVAGLMNPYPFHQPFVPQDMWQMPVTFDWDWGAMQSDGFSAGPDGQQPSGMMP